MKTFKDAAYLVLRKSKRPLHISTIVELASRNNLLPGKGKTPVATMAAQLAVDVKTNKPKSRFHKVAPSTYTINKDYKEPKNTKAIPGLKPLSEDFVKNAIIKWLSSNGWGHFEFDDLHTHGVDIKAKHHKYSRYFFIETKGQGKIPQGNESYFISSLGQIVTRMKTGKTTRNYYALGLPEVISRIAIRRLPWQVAKKLLMYIFTVGQTGAVTSHSWKDLKKAQSQA